MIKLRLSKGEKKVIRRVIDIQLKNLHDIRNNECPSDLIISCIEHDITQSELNHRVDLAIQKFQYVHEHPTELLILDEDDLSIFRHILHVLFRTKKYKKEKRQIWSKLFTYEDLVIKYPSSLN